MHKMPKMKKFPVSVPAELHRKFKTKCAAEGIMMADVVRRLLERECGAVDETKPVARRRLGEGVVA
jgi:CRISPR/Cas system-associated protein Csm6